MKPPFNPAQLDFMKTPADRKDAATWAVHCAREQLRLALEVATKDDPVAAAEFARQSAVTAQVSKAISMSYAARGP